MPVEPVCPACGGPTAIWRTMESAEPGLRGRRFTLRRCAACGTAVTVEPAPPESYETGAYAPGTPRGAGLAAPILAAFDRARLRRLRRLVPPPARLLDAGAGRGRFVAAARGAGYEATGIEPSARGVAGARAIGAPVVRAGIADAPIEPGSLDAVTLWHVLEHLDDPAAALATILGWLRPGGALLLGVPNLGSVQARLAPVRWYHLDVPRHRVHFTVAGIEALLRRTGFRVVTVDHVLLEHNPFGFWQSLVSRVTRRPSYLYNLLKRNAPLWSLDLAATLLAVPLAPAAALAEWIAGRRGRGGTISVLAIRAE
jgi:SAM-dependent methyltransferase